MSRGANGTGDPKARQQQPKKFTVTARFVVI